jgi:hypothetical protein
VLALAINRNVAQPDTAAAATTTKRIAVVMVNFTNDSISGVESVRQKAVTTYFGSAADALANYYLEASDSRITFGPLSGKPQVLGPWTISMAAACDHSQINTKTREALTANGIASTDFDHLSIIFPQRIAQCPWAGLGQAPGPVTWIPDPYVNTGVVVHEIGHNLGYSHLSTYTCNTGTVDLGCANKGYYSMQTPMGAGGPRTGLAPTELIHSGWVTDGQLHDVEQAGTFNLVPLHAAASTTGLRILRVVTGSGHLVIGFRKNGNTLDQEAGEGVVLFMVDGNWYNKSRTIDPTPATTTKSDIDLDVGAKIIDQVSGTTVETVSLTATSATVKVTPGAVTAGAYVAHGGRCLETSGGGSADGTPVALWDCHGGGNQHWARAADQTMRVLGKCLDLRNGSTADGTTVQLGTCNGSASQQWVDGADDTIRNPGSGKCLNAEGTGYGSAVTLRACNGSAGQAWTLREPTTATAKVGPGTPVPEDDGATKSR